MIAQLVSLLVLSWGGDMAAAVDDAPPSTIVSGTQAGTCQWPSAVAMLEADETPSMCTGTLVHPNVVMTAGHCILDERPIVAVGFGEHSEQSGVPQREVEVIDCVQHPGWVSEGWPDMGYCVLANAVTDVPIVPVMAGCEVDAMQVGGEVQIIGFGATFGEVDKEGNTSGTGVGAKRLTTQLVDDLQFEDSYTALTWPSGSHGACFGDSGGPGMARLADGTWRVFGIAAHLYDPGTLPPPAEPGNICGTGAVYTWATPNIEWLEASSGFDVTPCWQGDAWQPNPGCGAWPASPDLAGGSWDNGCTGDFFFSNEPSCEPVAPPVPPDPPEPPVDTGDDFGESSGGFGEDGEPPLPPSNTGQVPPPVEPDPDPDPFGTGTGEIETGSDGPELLGADALTDRGCACGVERSRPTPIGLGLLVLGLLAVRRRRR